MGILDDAIKEHLELKRAHGAPEDELKQKEAEAFGPIRQDAAPAAPPAPAAPEVPAPALDEVDPEIALYEDAATEYEPEVAAPAFEPDPHHHDASPLGSDPPYREDSAVFAEAPAAPAPTPPVEHHDDPHPALHEHDDLRGDLHPPEPVFQAEPDLEAQAAAPEVEVPPAEPGPAEEPPAPEPEPEPAPEPEPVAEAGEEDVLEETPEFLQDAPEHDRLWFEQRPPRDFDFGE